MNKNQYLGKSSPYWGGVIGSIVGIVIGLFAVINDWQVQYPPIDSRFFLCVCCCGLMYSSVYYRLYSDHLVMVFLGIPIRRIPRSKISGARHMRYWQSKDGKEHLNCVFLTLRPALPFCGWTPKDKKIFKWTHPFQYAQLNVPEGKDAEFVPVLEKCLGFPIKWQA